MKGCEGRLGKGFYSSELGRSGWDENPGPLKSADLLRELEMRSKPAAQTLMCDTDFPLQGAEESNSSAQRQAGGLPHSGHWLFLAVLEAVDYLMSPPLCITALQPGEGYSLALVAIWNWQVLYSLKFKNLSESEIWPKYKYCSAGHMWSILGGNRRG